MQFSAVFVAVAVAVSGVSSTPTTDININIFSASNHYGAPLAPWVSGSKPGWYYGGNPKAYPGIPCLEPSFCKQLSYNPYGLQCPKNKPPPPPPYKKPPPPPPPPPHHTTKTPPHKTSKTTSSGPTQTPPPPPPPPPSGYTPTFSNITCATQADDYLTFGLVDTEADCLAMCDSVAGCNFVNVYDDVNGKGGSTQLTCSLFGKCHDASTADNCGGQSQPDGSVDFITNSDGFCRDGQKVSDPN